MGNDTKVFDDLLVKVRAEYEWEADKAEVYRVHVRHAEEHMNGMLKQIRWLEQEIDRRVLEQMKAQSGKFPNAQA